MKYCSYTISKYNPKYFDEFGIYTKDEWTSKYDIDKVFNNEKFTENEYLQIENNYVLAVEYILNEFKISELVVSKLEKHHLFHNENDVQSINEGDIVNKSMVYTIIRALLRDHLWCELYSKEKHFILSAGYDFYLHLICEQLNEKQINRFSQFGLFVQA